MLGESSVEWQPLGEHIGSHLIGGDICTGSNIPCSTHSWQKTARMAEARELCIHEASREKLSFSRRVGLVSGTPAHLAWPGKKAGWLWSAADVGDDGSEKPRLHAVGKVPTVAAMGGPEGGSDQTQKQSAHQAAIWVALEYAGQCLSKGSRVTLTVESATALRNLHDAPADEEARPGADAQGGVAAQTPHRDTERPGR